MGALQFFVGSILVSIAVAIWYSKRNSLFKSFLEKIFLPKGLDLFDEGKAHSTYVKWGRFTGFWAGLAMLIPSAMLWDLMIGMVAAAIFWRMNKEKIDHDASVRNGEKINNEA